MAERDTLSFSENHIQNLITAPSHFSAVKLSTSAKQLHEVEKLTRLHKKHIRTELHGHFLLEHLKAGTIPWGLQVKNLPVIFVDDAEYKKGFSFINTKCSRDLMVHTIETAKRICLKEQDALEKLIQTIRDNQSVSEAKELLEKIEKEIQIFKDISINNKTAKFEKDTKAFNIEQVYPFLKEDYYTSIESRRALTTYQGRSRNHYSTFSETSSSESSGDQDQREGPAKKQVSFLDRGRKRPNTRLRQPWEMRTRNRFYRT